MLIAALWYLRGAGVGGCLVEHVVTLLRERDFHWLRRWREPESSKHQAALVWSWPEGGRSLNIVKPFCIHFGHDFACTLVMTCCQPMSAAQMITVTTLLVVLEIMSCANMGPCQEQVTGSVHLPVLPKIIAMVELQVRMLILRKWMTEVKMI